MSPDRILYIVDGSTIVNPLEPGHLGPYSDSTVPSVSSIRFRTSVTSGDLMPELLRGRVEMLANGLRRRILIPSH